MATSQTPQPVVPKVGGYERESNTFASIGDAFRFFQPKRMKMSKNSPPVKGVDVTEGELIYDKTLNRIYTVADNTLRFVQFT